MALTNLEKVTASLGAKGVLWELFSFNPPSLKLYVDLCAGSAFLSQILICNPGMIDELLDSLVLNQPKTRAELEAELMALCGGSTDTDPILHSFRDKELLHIGVCDLLGKEDLPDTLAALSDLAETLLCRVVAEEYRRLAARWGEPVLADGQRPGQVCRYAFLGLGKLGGREMSYSSDLDLVLVYEGDGRTEGKTGYEARHARRTPSASESREMMANLHFFTELGQRVSNRLGRHGPFGRLYAVDMRLRPTGKSGSLATPLTEFRRYYATGGAQLWERQALTRARAVNGNEPFAADVMMAVHDAAYGPPWQPAWADEMLTMRERLEESRPEGDLKRGFGGVVDVEFLVQLFQLKYGRTAPALRTPNTRAALTALAEADLLEPEIAAELTAAYDFLRRVESRLRIVHNLSQDQLPERAEDVEKLARRLGYEANDGKPAASVFEEDMERRTARLRDVFLALMEREKGK
jgi:glutamate-ammonia-ligase adenylyltransferase